MARFNPWEEDVNKFAQAYARLNKRALLAWLTGIGIVGGGFVDGEPNHWPLYLEPWWITLNAGFLGLTEFYTHQATDKTNSVIASLKEKLEKYEPTVVEPPA